jgi:bifunctional DNase/RNase
VSIGVAEANIMMLEQRGTASGPRPITHELIGHVLASFGRRLMHVRITKVRDEIFYAELYRDAQVRDPGRPRR